MNTPSTNIYIRPGSTSYAWNYLNTSVGSGAGASAVVAVAFDTVSSAGQQVARGEFRYSVDGGRNWYAYTLAADREGAWMTAGTLWRFVDKLGNDLVSPGSFTMRFKLADNSTVTANAAVVVDNAPVGLVDDRDTMFASLHAGDTVATLAPIDTGAHQAAFDRTPDLAGLGYWIAQMDRGLSLNDAAAAFSSSLEFVGMYGAHSTDAQFVDLLYQNVLHRQPEAAGYAFWMESLGTHHLAREAMLGIFSESVENQAQVIGSIEHGIDFVPWN
jgi:hypothetical protein